MIYAVLLTETFQNQHLALPQRELPRVMEKISLLRSSPEVDSKAKKRLMNYKRSVYRIRAGDYRILYSFGSDWIKLIGVDHRKDVYHKGELVDYDDPAMGFSEVIQINELIEPSDVPFVSPKYNWRHMNDGLEPVHLQMTSPGTPLGRQITVELLASIRIARQHFDALTTCQTDIDLKNADVPEDIRNRVFDIVTARNYASVDQQPVKKLSNIDDLEEFHQGKLLDFQLLLDPTQKSIISRIAKGDGPYRIKGAPGTGKSTVLLYAISEFQYEWRKRHAADPKILFTTYTNALTNTSRQLLQNLLVDSSSRLEITTVTRVARGIVDRFDGPPKLQNNEQGFLLYEIKQAANIFRERSDSDGRRELDSLLERMPWDYLVDEIEKLIVGRDIVSLEEYRDESRAGRQRQLGRNQRALVWQLHEIITQRFSQKHVTTWS